MNNNTQIIANDTQAVRDGDNSGHDATRDNQDRPQFCPRCGKVGHIANVCPSPVVCSRCHKEGHVARVCLTKMP